jgi:hypothetical protein
MNISQTLEGMGQEMWNWAKQQQQTMGDTFQQYLGMAMPAAEENFAWARDMRRNYEEKVMPQIDSLFADADKYASKEEEMRQRGAAIQDVKSATEAQRAAQLRKLESFGVDPTDTRYAALDKQAGVAEAAASALAANQAGERTKEIGRQLRREAIDVGTGFLNEANAGYQQGANIGLSGINAGTATTQAGVQAGQSPLPYYSGASGAANTAAGIVDTSYGRQLDYAEDQRASESNLGGLGGLVGYGLSMIPTVGPVAQAAMGAAGGAKAAEGGPIAAPGGPMSDGGALAVSDGEYVVPADVVRKLGTNYFDKMIEKETGRPPPGAKTAIPIGST